MAEKKMYYTEQEAAQRLGVTQDELANLVSQQKLRVFHDGPRRMYKASEVDELAAQTPQPIEPPPAADSEGTAEIELAPVTEPGASGSGPAIEPPETPAEEPTEPPTLEAADTSLGSGAPISLEQSDTAAAEGVSIFDEQDQQDETSPMAKTSIRPGVEEQVTLEGVGSGSGLLDLTRESDDTSLGAEVLQNIDMESALDTSLGEPGSATASYAPPEEEPAAPSAIPSVEQAPSPAVAVVSDPTAGLFGGIVVACCILMLVLAAVVASSLMGIVPAFLEIMKNNLLIVLGAGAGIVIISAVVGLFVGKSAGGAKEPSAQTES